MHVSNDDLNECLMLNLQSYCFQLYQMFHFEMHLNFVYFFGLYFFLKSYLYALWVSWHSKVKCGNFSIVSVLVDAPINNSSFSEQ